MRSESGRPRDTLDRPPRARLPRPPETRRLGYAWPSAQLARIRRAHPRRWKRTLPRQIDIALASPPATRARVNGSSARYQADQLVESTSLEADRLPPSAVEHRPRA